MAETPSNQQSGTIEKRQFERVSTRMQVRFEEIAEAEADRLMGDRSYKDLSLPDTRDVKVKDVMTVVAENISIGGLLIVGSRPFRAGQTLKMEITLPQTPVPLKALAVIVRAMEAAGGKHTAGVRFLGINKEDVAKIERYIFLQKKAEQAKKA